MTFSAIDVIVACKKVRQWFRFWTRPWSGVDFAITLVVKFLGLVVHNLFRYNSDVVDTAEISHDVLHIILQGPKASYISKSLPYT